MGKTLAEAIATTADARTTSDRRGNSEWEVRHEDQLRKYERNRLPSGGGFDAGTTIDREKSGLDRLVFQTSFHHMSEHGYYSGWTEHVVTARPSFLGLDIKVSGPNRNDIKDYIAETFHQVLSEPA